MTMTDEDWPLDEVLRTLVAATLRHMGDSACTPQEHRRLRSAVKAARDLIALAPTRVEACVVGGCTGDGSWRWPTLDGGTVPTCARHHDAAVQLVERKGLDEEEALWRAGRE